MVLQLKSDQALQRRKRLLKMLTLMVAIFGLCWLPFNVLNILRDVMPSHFDDIKKNLTAWIHPGSWQMSQNKMTNCIKWLKRVAEAITTFLTLVETQILIDCMLQKHIIFKKYCCKVLRVKTEDRYNFKAYLLQGKTQFSSNEVHLSQKPALTGIQNNFYIKKHVGDSLTLNCGDDSSVKWKLPNNTIYKGFSDPTVDGRLQTFSDSGLLVLQNLRLADTGLYTCIISDNKDGKDFTMAEHGTYVYVIDPKSSYLFLHWNDEMDSYSHLIPLHQSNGGYIDCLVTDPDAEVRLYVNEKLIRQAIYNPKRGFFVKPQMFLKNKSTSSPAAAARCEAALGQKEDKLQFLLVVVAEPVKLHPWIEGVSPPYPYIGGEMQISCLNYFQQSFQGYCSWSYPSMGDKDTSMRIVVFQEVEPRFNITLKFKNVTQEDEGIYSCTCSTAGKATSETVSKFIQISSVKGYVKIIHQLSDRRLNTTSGKSVKIPIEFEAWPLEEMHVFWYHSYETHNGLLSHDMDHKQRNTT
ncbi:Platelet-derived growth factor receptor alpha [Trichinella spiralis]|uniref:Platelet-derived growth factor receptor-like protein n=1 Tax=Trichinella spiralis TaxID=6334 RepID=A0ABR3KI33_TRISP